ncbi:unnamed protein product [Zymoseptoria tritici ST99CH_3D1]|uniref:Uncharacterized protein n=2 Tax=Zymoseptoria tritici TaxID=1047171 RepID=F9XF39_ZYMTI|nr:uncharacterized protein MYCGRDRAFT_94767 [Zymoseptoria tritici IPO323]EGP85857.1 hypothetical protein MYCGRDRAFT_94767 [Zymoseptoria tritici IPO323]SMQ52872.1 unnamed protein product [Zymoseptoria tritici ST99CH_3D7]SMR58074.1 unnamed protein product [Zymoseptoria tritici ST99CH_3D1]
MDTTKSSAAQRRHLTRTSTPLDAPMIDSWCDLPREMMEIIILEATTEAAMAPLRVTMTAYQPGQPRCIRAVDQKKWFAFVDAIRVTKSSRRMLLRNVHADGSLELVSLTGYRPKRLYHPSPALLAHFGLIWRSMGFRTPSIDNLDAGSPIDEACVGAQVKFFVPLPRPGQPQSVVRIEIVSSINPIPVLTNSEVRRKVAGWLRFASWGPWAFGIQRDPPLAAPLPVPATVNGMRALLRWVEK